MKEFPEECLEVSGVGRTKLFCKACREELSLKKNVNCLSRVIGEAQDGERETYREGSERKRHCEVVKKGDVTHPVGETLPMDQRVY